MLVACLVLQCFRNHLSGMVKPCDFFQKHIHNLLYFPFIDALNAFCPDATRRQTLRKCFFFYLNSLHIHSFSRNISKFASSKCCWNIDICQIRISSKGLLHFHSFILLSWTKLAWRFSYYWFSLSLNQLPKGTWLNELYHPEFHQLQWIIRSFLLDYVHEIGFMIMSVQHTHCSIQLNNFLSALYIQIIWEQAFSI